MVRSVLLAIAFALGLAARGKRRRKVNPTVAHRDHLHIGMTRAGARAETSFWRAHR